VSVSSNRFVEPRDSATSFVNSQLTAAPVTDLTALVLTYNEAANIQRTLGKLQWIPKVVVLDSHSTDETISICQKFPNVEVKQRVFDSFAGQCNYGLSLITTEWILSIDADYVFTDELIEEMRSLPNDSNVAGYKVRFRYCIDGIPLRRTLLPPRTVLYRRSTARYADEGHGHRVQINGIIQDLNGCILHDDRKPLSRWLASQISYAEKEAKHLSASRPADLALQDQLRLWIVPAPFLVLAYCLVGQRLMTDGWRGWFYVMQRVFAEVLLSLELLELKFLRTHGSSLRIDG
jgi:glycosyltransferase involved in cell wall biosynthesis